MEKRLGKIPLFLKCPPPFFVGLLCGHPSSYLNEHFAQCENICDWAGLVPTAVHPFLSNMSF